MTQFAKEKWNTVRCLWLALAMVLLVCATAIQAQAQPVIQCPEGTVTVCVTQLGEVSVPLAIEEATGVEIEGLSDAVWQNSILTFNADSVGTRQVTVRAMNGEAADTCTFMLAVSMGQKPSILCPTVPFQMQVCGPTEICVNLPETAGAGQVTTSVISTPTKTTRALASSTAIRTEGTEQCCLFVDTTGTYEIEVIATNACGADTCIFSVYVTVGASPVISCPAEPHNFQVCELGELTLPLEIADANSVEVSGPGNPTWANGTLTFTPNAAGDYNFDVTATSDCGTATCTVNASVTVLPQPVIACPEVPVVVDVCETGRMCVPLAVADADEVLAFTDLGNASWIDGTLCFDITESGTYPVLVTATNGCGTDSCSFEVQVTVGQKPAIACISDTLELKTCDMNVCLRVPLEFSFADSVTVSDGATWGAENMLCFDASEGGLYSFLFTAYNKCGTDTCRVYATIMHPASPEIACPAEPLSVVACPDQEVCVYLPITDASVVTVDGAAWNNDSLCFRPSESGSHEFMVVAQGECSSDTCVFSVNVTITPPAQITCPDQEAMTLSTCTMGELCFALSVTGADSVLMSNGTWADNKVCFTADTVGLYTFTAIAYQTCGNDTCTFAVNVTQGTPSDIVCPAPNALNITSCELGEKCFALEISAADSVVSNLGAWDDGQLCFTADTAGAYSFTVVAYSGCGNDTCTFVVNVVQTASANLVCPTPENSTITSCTLGELCFPLEATDADSVITSLGTWEDGQVCFIAENAGDYTFSVVAYSACGNDTCNFTITVVQGNSATLVCPNPESTTITSCTLGELCFPLEASGADSVITSLGTWEDGNVCFMAETAGDYAFTVIAYSACGSDTCNFTITVVQGNSTSLVCPNPESTTITSCTLGELCFPLEATNADSVITSLGTWGDGQVCFMAETAGDYAFTVIAYSTCGSDTCNFTITVVQPEQAEISCPDIDPLVISSCTLGEKCFALSVSEADSVHINLGTWADNQVCFMADTAGTYSFVAIAYNDCSNDTCEFVVMVEQTGQLPELCFNSTIVETPSRTVQFTDCTPLTDEVSFSWHFGDNASSTDLNPVHTYELAGCYDVTLVRVAECGTDSLTKTVCVTDDGEIVTPTDQWISIYCAAPQFDSVYLEPGDVITAYDPDNVLCGMGTIEPDGKLKFMPIYHDDIYSLDIDEGAEEGDTIHFKVNGVDATVDPTVVWTENGDRFNICDFAHFTGECLTLEFKQGWNLVSWNVTYTDDVANLVDQLGGCVDFVLGFEQGGLTYDPQLEIYSTLHQVDYSSGYWFYMNCPATLKLCNGPIPSEEVIQIHSGWNLVGYWPSENLSVENGWQTILSSIDIAYTYNDGIKIWQPGQGGFNTLTELMPEYGYWIKSQNDAVLAYPGWGSVVPDVARARGTDVNGVSTTRSWISLYGKNLTLDGMLIANGTTIEARSENGAVCGKGAYAGGILRFTPVYGEDNSGEVTKSYPSTGERVMLYVNDSRVYPDVQWTENGAQIQLAALSSVEGASVPATFALSQNYPNPFNPTTQIVFSLPTSGQVSIDIYNMMGRKITTIVNGSFEAGEHTVTWDATDSDGRPVAGGVYLYRLTSGNFEATRKMVLIK